MSFLELNPDLKEEFESFVEIVIEPDTKQYLREKKVSGKGAYTFRKLQNLVGCFL